MENMIKRIVDMDKKARDITAAARQEKIDCEKEIAQKAKALRAEYLDRARRRIQINAETERTLAQQAWKKQQARYTEQTERLESRFAENKDAWVDAIVARALARNG